MTHSQYVALMETLDASVDNGYDDTTVMSPEEVYRDILDDTGDRTWEDVPRDELYAAIRKWQEKNEKI